MSYRKELRLENPSKHWIRFSLANGGTIETGDERDDRDDTFAAEFQATADDLRCIHALIEANLKSFGGA